MKINFKNISAVVMVVISSLLLSLPTLAEDSQGNAKKAGSAQELEVVSINTATAKELSKNLKGIGKAKAEAIVAYRDANGEFKKIEDLLKVDGIGKKVLENNKERIRL